MSDLYFFDTDCLSSFLLTNNEFILLSLFNNKIILSSLVLNEANKYEPLKQKVKILINQNLIKIQEIEYGSEEYKLYYKLTNINYSAKIIGKGEASAIALCKINNGTLVSDNLKDVDYYIKKFELKSLTTSQMLVNAYKNKLISNIDANTIWNNMLSINRKLPENSFDDYYQKYHVNVPIIF